MAKKLYVGTYNGKGEDSLFCYNRLEDGGFEQAGSFAGVEKPSYLALGGPGWVYAVSETDAFGGEPGGAVAALCLGDEGFSLLGMWPTKGSPCHVLFDEKRRMLLAANYGGGSVASFGVAPDGLPIFRQLWRHTGHGPNAQRQEGPHVHFCGWFDERIYAADLGTDTLVCYEVADGLPMPCPQKDIHMPPGSGVRHFAVDARWPGTLFAVCELSCQIMMVGKRSDEISVRQVLDIGLPEAGDSAAAIRISPGGRFLLASVRGRDSIAVVRLDKEADGMELVDAVSSQGRTPRDMAWVDGRLIVANQDSDTLCVFDFDEERGKLLFAGRKIACPKPVCVVAD